MDRFCPVGIGGTHGIDTTDLKIFVAGLLQSQSSKDLHDLFVPFGIIREAVIIPDRLRARSRCYGFVESLCIRIFLYRRFHIVDLYLIRHYISYNVIIRQVTFVDKSSVIEVLDNLPFTLYNGKELTVTLAASNAKPRRAQFTVKHGVSGHKSLPQNPGENLIYDDPSLLRTANIQPIEPATLETATLSVETNQTIEPDTLSMTATNIRKRFVGVQ